MNAVAAGLLALSVKRCGQCRSIRHLDDFSKCVTGLGGKHTYCKSCERTNKREWCARNRAHSRERCNNWRAANLEAQRARDRQRNRRTLSAPEGRIRKSIASRMREALQAKGTPKGGRTFDLLGYSPGDLKTHLERQFTKGMNWQNMGEWHIDHILPLVGFAFESTSDPEFKRAWSLPNLRPLWGSENKSKGGRRVTLL